MNPHCSQRSKSVESGEKVKHRGNEVELNFGEEKLFLMLRRYERGLEWKKSTTDYRCVRSGGMPVSGCQLAGAKDLCRFPLVVET